MIILRKNKHTMHTSSPEEAVSKIKEGFKILKGKTLVESYSKTKVKTEKTPIKKKK
tara:strand:- start:453 stop:620 length:168 start_codon:yes stop_codon:yes gene_type:complete